MDRMDRRDIIVIGASAGGVEALTTLMRELPPTLAAAIFVTLHFPAHGRSVLPRILGRAGPLEAAHPENGAPIEHGRIYVAPPDHHLIVLRKTVRVIRGPTENGNRPAVDPMFRSAAVAHGRRVIGMVLTGNLDDGTSGLLAIKRRGGVAVVQDPAEATFPSMPTSAIEHVDVDHIAGIADIAPLLARLVCEPLPEEPQRAPADADDAGRETAYSAFDMRTIEEPEQHPGEPSGFACPDCGGVLWEIQDGELVRYRCRVGHGWTSDGLLAQQSDTLEAALWTALRALEESASLNHQMANRVRRRGATSLVRRFAHQASVADRRAELIREVLMSEHAPQVESDAEGTRS